MATIGAQLMMFRDEVDTLGPYEIVRQVAEIGYRAVEVSQLPMTPENVAELARGSRDLGVVVGAVSGSLSDPPFGDSLLTQFDKIVADARALGTTNVRVGGLPRSAMRSRETIVEFAQLASSVADRLARHGMRLFFHNHHHEFAKYGDATLLDLIVRHAPNVDLELDVHWVWRGGHDPERTILTYGERVGLVHLKDYRMVRPPESAFELLDAGDETGFAAAFTGLDRFAEVGEGALDFPAIIDAAQRVGAEYLFVEQDDTYGRSPREALQTSHDNLVSLGYGDLF